VIHVYLMITAVMIWNDVDRILTVIITKDRVIQTFSLPLPFP